MSTRSGGASSIRGRHKERSKNFTELEKRTVLELIARHRDVLRQGRSNNATNKSKQLVWSRICEEVNARCGGERPRTAAQVKMWYENYKKKCKMRAGDVPPTQAQTSEGGLLDGLLWQTIVPLDVKDEEPDGAESVSLHSHKDDDCLPVNMSNGRNSTENEDASSSVLEPHVQIIPQASPPTKMQIPLTNPLQLLANPLAIQQEYARFQKSYAQNFEMNTPLNLSHLDSDERKTPSEKSIKNNYEKYRDSSNATEEERLYFTAKRQHAIWEHEAKMKLLNMELRQKEEIFSLQKQLFLIELKLKMDFLEKSCNSK